MTYMWIPKDTATLLSILALILVIPFNFFTTWAYPKLQNWWAARSRKSLIKRIDKLKASLADMSEGWSMSITHEWVLICAQRLGSLIYWGVNLIVFVVMIVSVPTIRSLHHPNIIIVLFTLILTCYRVFRDYWMAEITSFRRFAGAIVKIQLEQSIEELELKLAGRERTQNRDAAS